MKNIAYTRRRWALSLIRRCATPPPSYGTAEWLALPEGSPERIAAVVIAAEAWASAGDTLEEDLRREVEASRLAHKEAEDADYAARAAAHRQSAPRPVKGFQQRRSEQLARDAVREDSRPKAGESGWGA